METLFVSDRVFVIPDEGTFILYEPLAGSVLRANEGLINLLQRVKEDPMTPIDPQLKERLMHARIVAEEPIPEAEIEAPDNRFTPSRIVLQPTTDCNLRCKYCYSDGGADAILLDEEIATRGIDFALDNAEALGETCGVTFHGAGESLHHDALPLVRRVVEYAQHRSRERRIPLHVSATTNGVIAENDLGWLIENFQRFQVSLDGPAFIQDEQRPTANGKPSFPIVMRTLDALTKAGIEYSVRATASEFSTPHLAEITEFFMRNTTTKFILIGPLDRIGRALEADEPSRRAPTNEAYVANLVKARGVARAYGREMPTFDWFWRGRHAFCGTTGMNVVVTPEGYLSACHEMCRKSNPLSSTFFIGQYDREAGKFSFDEERIDALSRRHVGNMDDCSKCFIKYSCAGGCAAKTMEETGSIYRTQGSSRCDLGREIGRIALKTLLETGEKI